ncbi:dTDP-4-dehydrorhamnose reductase [bacterium]|nr:dTDP-4-dehydrorhamnose reductase [bacterium]
MNNVLITGAGGQLGSELREKSLVHPKLNIFGTDHQQLDITKYSEINDFIKKNEINSIINCAAFTEVEKAEVEPRKADNINSLAVENLAMISKRQGLKLIHISTDYVFDGKHYCPYTETDKPNPQSIYGKTKLAGELAIQKINPSNTVIIRTSWLYSKFGNNFVRKMLDLGDRQDLIKVVDDQIGTPTNAGDLAAAILHILPRLHKTEVEIYHFSSEGLASWFDFAKQIFLLNELPKKLEPVASGAYPSSVTRPFYSVLNNSKIKKEFGISIPYWLDSLETMVLASRAK